MTPLNQTLLTLLCMGLAYWWGNKEGFTEGVAATVRTLIQHKFLTDEDLERLHILQRELDDE